MPWRGLNIAQTDTERSGRTHRHNLFGRATLTCLLHARIQSQGARARNENVLARGTMSLLFDEDAKA